MLVHVVDGLIGTAEVAELKAALKGVFDIKDIGPTTGLLGVRVARHLDKGTIKLDQEVMIIAVLDRFGMGDCKPANLPMLGGLHGGPAAGKGLTPRPTRSCWAA
eukprot:361525-Chlamydomonas_euryale.AAC.3